MGEATRFLAAFLFAGTSAFAIPPAARGATSEVATAVFLAFETQRESGERLEKALATQLTDSGISLAVDWLGAPEAELASQIRTARSAAAAHGALSVFWYVDLTQEEGLLCLTDATSARLLVRRLPWTTSEARSETIAVIIESALDAIRRGGTIGVVEPVLAAKADGAPTVPPPAPQPTRAEPAAPRRFVWGFEAGAVYQARSKPVPAMFGADLSIAAAPTPWLALRAGFTLWNRAEIEGELADIEIRRVPYRLGASCAGRVGPLRLEGGVSVVLDDAHQTTVEILSEDPAALSRSNRDLVVSLLPEIAAALAVVPRLNLFLSLGAEIPLNRVSYTYRTATSVEDIETAWAVQPRATLGARVMIF